MTFTIAWPNGTRTNKKMKSLRELDEFVSEKFEAGIDVELWPTSDGPLLIIGDALFKQMQTRPVD